MSGWINLGHFVPPGTADDLYGRQTRVQLPDNVEKASGGMYTIGPSLICVVVCFFYKSALQRSFDRALRESYATEFRRQKRGHRIVDPRFRRSEEIRRIRQTARSAVSNWFKTNLSGALCSGVESGPAFCDFIVFENAPSEGQQKRFLLPRSSLYRPQWTSSDLFESTFVWPLTDDPKDRSHAVLCCDVSSFKADKHWSDQLHLYTDMHIPGMLVKWGCLSLLSLYQYEANENRDSSFFKFTPHVDEFLRTLRGLTNRSLDIAATVPDIVNAIETGSLFETLTDSFALGDGDNALKLDAVLDREIVAGANKVRDIEKLLRDILVLQGSLLATAENIALQRQMKTMTILVILLTVATLVVGVIPLIF
jgi:hypothetical protein